MIDDLKAGMLRPTIRMELVTSVFDEIANCDWHTL